MAPCRDGSGESAILTALGHVASATDPSRELGGIFMRLNSCLFPGVLFWIGLLGSGTGSVGVEERATHLAPTGYGAWSGRLAASNADHIDGPVASLDRATQRVRKLKKAEVRRAGPIQIYLSGGTYSLKEPLELWPDDWGTADSLVVWAPYQQEQPILPVDERITRWAATKGNDGDAWVAKLQRRAGSPLPRDLRLGGKRPTRASCLKQGSLAGA